MMSPEGAMSGKGISPLGIPPYSSPLLAGPMGGPPGIGVANGHFKHAPSSDSDSADAMRGGEVFFDDINPNRKKARVSCTFSLTYIRPLKENASVLTKPNSCLCAETKKDSTT